MSFILELSFNGLILIDQRGATSADPGIHLFMPTHSTHVAELFFDKQYSHGGAISKLVLNAGYDFYSAGSGVVQSTAIFASLSAIEKRTLSVDTGWFAPSLPRGLNARIRLPLGSSLVPDRTTVDVDLEFTNAAGATTRQTLTETGVFTATVNATCLMFGAQQLCPVNGVLQLGLVHLPASKPPALKPPCTVPHHHIHALYDLLVPPGTKAPAGPSVYFHKTVGTAPPLAALRRGGDPAQCTPAFI